MTKQLSPAAQAVLDAYGNSLTTEPYTTSGRIETAVAAALRAVADQVDYHERLGWTGYGYYTEFQNQILTIAAELENSNG